MGDLGEPISFEGDEGSPVYHKVFMGFISIISIVQAILVTIVHNKFTDVDDSNVKAGNVISVSYGWEITLWLLFAITLVITILIWIPNLIKESGQLIVLFYLIILLIINLALLGVAFYFQSQEVGSSDYVKATSGDNSGCIGSDGKTNICENAVSLKDTIIALLVITGIMIGLLIIYFIVFYFKFRGGIRGRGVVGVLSKLAGRDTKLSGDTWFKDDDNRFQGKTCNKWFDQFQKHFLEYLKYRELTNSNDKLDKNTKEQILNSVVQSLIRNSGATSSPVAATE